MIKLYDKKSECCGCGACVDVCPKNAISMKEDHHGFNYPVINKELCIECGKCQKVCAFKDKDSNADFAKAAYAVKIIDDNARMNSSSGGIYTAISDFILSKEGVVYGAAYTAADAVSHVRCKSVEERDRTRGSKYTQSDMTGVYTQIKKDLADGRYVLFTGTPCQTAAVRRMFKAHSEKLFLVDMICHGVPSPGLFKEHISYCEKKKNKKISEFVFRQKLGDGRNQTPAAIFDDNEQDDKSKYIRVYYDLFNEKKILRETCFVCPYASESRPGDITIGDFWGLMDTIHDFYDGNGVSAVIINTPKGRELFEKVSGVLDIRESNYEDISKHNPNLKRPTQRPKRSSFWLLYGLLGYSRCVRSYTENTIIRRLKTGLLKLLK